MLSANSELPFTIANALGRFVVAALLVAFPLECFGQAAKPIDFAHAVAPILKKHCLACHGGSESKGGFSLNTRELMFDADVVTAGQAVKSRLFQLVTSQDAEDQMPPKGRPRLSDKEVDVLKRWIDAGAKWTAGVTFAQRTYEPPLRPRAVALPPATKGRAHPVDRIIHHYWSLLDEPRSASPASPVVPDAAFARRVYMDLHGLLPTPEQLAEFLGDSRTDKRERLVRQLLDDEIAYAEHWLTFWNDLLRNDYTGTGFITRGRKQITGWLYDSLLSNKPYDQFVRELIAPTPESEGFIMGIRWRGNVNSSQTPEVQFAQNVSQALLGINMKCASCHDSFIDRWTLEETYGLAQVYATTSLELHRCDKPTGKHAKAAWMFPELGQVDPEADQPKRLRQLAGLMTHPENGRLTRTIVNRIWHRLMGRGIVHPVDAMHTEPWCEDLLDYLANDFAEHKYDLKHAMFRICTSHAYQASIPPASEPVDPNGYVYGGPLPRRMTAEQFMDSVWQLTGAAPNKPDADVIRSAPKDRAASTPNVDQSAVPTARWIWRQATASSAAPAGEKVTFRHRFELKLAPTAAVAAITCDNSYQWWVNGRNVGADGNWESVEIVSLASHLKKGNNEILVLATNGGAGPNPAGLMAELSLILADGQHVSVGTSGTWEWTAATPNGRGQFAKGQKLSWAPAVAVENPAVWAAANSQFRTARALGANASIRMVRASLVKNNALMRALGRPNRDQIVTSRPTGLTTLEAIDLANGQMLADAIAAGAELAIAEHQTAEPITRWLFLHALAREPTQGEIALATQLLGEDQCEPRAVEDLIWSVLMLPEFQLIR